VTVNEGKGASDHAGELLGFVLLGAIGLSLWAGGYAVYQNYEEKHADYPAVAASKPGQPITRWEAYETVSWFVKSNAHTNVDRELHLSDIPIWSNPCNEKQSGVRVVTAVINPTTGETTDVTMYFCVNGVGVLEASNPEARYLTGQEKAQP
jgi:hypothetical protein